MANLKIFNGGIKKKRKNIFNGGFRKILEEQWQVDIQLKAGDSDEASAISAHKVILAARSNVFKTMFESDEFMKTCNMLETVTFSEMKQEELEAFIDFIYSSGNSLSEKHKQHAKSLYIAADKYDIPHLRDVSRDELIESIDMFNATELLEIAQIPFDKELNDKAFGFISSNLKMISNSSDFKLFVIRQPELTVKLMNAALGNESPNSRSGRYGPRVRLPKEERGYLTPPLVDGDSVPRWGYQKKMGF